MLLTLVEKADFLVEEDLTSMMDSLPDRDKLLLKVPHRRSSCLLTCLPCSLILSWRPWE